MSSIQRIARTPKRYAKRDLSSFGLLALCLGLLLGACTPRLPKRVVLITIDTLRLDTLAGRAPGELLDKALPADYPGFFQREGEALVTSMPFTRQWAQAGARFDRCYTVSPVTQPSHASLFTGLFPWQHGVTRNGQVLGAEYDTVAELLAREGWKTSAVIASYPLTKRMGLAQGFDRYVEELRLSRASSEWNGVDVEKFYSLGKTVTDRALKLLKEESGADQFLWVHYFDPHAPYGDTDPDAKEITLAKLQMSVAVAKHIEVARGGIKRAQRLYEADAFSLDRELSRLLKRLRSDEDKYETHIVLVADHGESFGEDDSLGHGRRLTEPQLRVPLVIRSTQLAKGLYPEPVGSVDVAKTLLALGGLHSNQFKGRDLTTRRDSAELVAGMRTSLKGELVDNRVEGESKRLSGERWFVFENGALLSGNSEEAYWDDDETRPVSGEDGERAKRLFGLFRDQMTGAVELDDEETRAALEALGYLGAEDE